MNFLLTIIFRKERVEASALFDEIINTSAVHALTDVAHL